MSSSRYASTRPPVPSVARHAVAKPLPLLGKQAAHVACDPLDLAAAGCDDGEQHDLGDVDGMRLCICQRQRRSPRPAQHEPPVDPDAAAQPLDVGEQMRSRVAGQIDSRVAGVGCTAPAAALVEQHDVIGVGVEQAPPPRRRARLGTSVQHDRRLAVRVPDLLPIDVVAVADGEHARGERLDRCVQTVCRGAVGHAS
jgi:hypothetical protein